MYYVHFKDKIVDDPYPMYQEISELIEADGEAENEWVHQIVDEQLPFKYFSVTDWKSNEPIDLDITDYIGNKIYNTFEECINSLEEFSTTKAISVLKACQQHERRKVQR